MEIQDYKWLLNNTAMRMSEIDGVPHVMFGTPYRRDREKLAQLFEKNIDCEGNASLALSEFLQLSAQMKETMRVECKSEECRQQVAEQKLDAMSHEQIASLSDAEKVRLLDEAMLPIYGKQSKVLQNIEVAKKHSDKFRTLLFSLNFPKELLKEEEQKNNRFNQLLKGIPHLKENLENYKNLTTEQRFDIAAAVVERFSYVYGVDGIKVDTFSEDEYRKAPEHADVQFVPTGYALDKTIHLNIDHLPKLDNLALVQMVYHEALHVYQHDIGFAKYPSVDKMMEEKTGYVAKGSQDKTDLYPLLPIEQHAYNFDKRTRAFLQDEMGIRCQESQHDATMRQVVGDIRSKAYAAFEHKKYRSSGR
jgi:hypothetical protein